MARRNDFGDVEFFFTFLVRPYQSPNWALVYSLIGTILVLLQAFVIGSPDPDAVGESPFSPLLEVFRAVLSLRLLIPAAFFSLVGVTGFATCFIREWREQRS
jgi:hypothetical protein